MGFLFSFFFNLYAGNIETKSLDTGVISRNVAIRNELDLFVNVIHCKSYSGVQGRQKGIDIVLVRQNTEGEYAMLEHEVSFISVHISSLVFNESPRKLFFGLFAEYTRYCRIDESYHCSEF